MLIFHQSTPYIYKGQIGFYIRTSHKRLKITLYEFFGDCIDLSFYQYVELYLSVASFPLHALKSLERCYRLSQINKKIKTLRIEHLYLNSYCSLS